MQLIFCSDPLEPGKPDSAYEAEVAAAKNLGLDYTVIDYEALVLEGNSTKAVRRVQTTSAPEIALYRGWMLTPEGYEQLYDALTARGIQLINDPSAYRHCHYLPESYAVIERFTPRSAWLRTGADPPIDRKMQTSPASTGLS